MGSARSRPVAVLFAVVLCATAMRAQADAPRPAEKALGVVETPSPSETPTSAETPSPTATAADTPTATATPADTIPPAESSTPTATEVETATPTPPPDTPTPTPLTPTRTATNTRTATPTRTITPTRTLTGTRTSTGTRTTTGTPTPGTGDCCSMHAGPGCTAAACQNCVCGADPLCCDPLESWDEFCVDRANSECASQCPCTGPTPTPTPGGDPCCNAHVGGGCGNSICETCVCQADAFCCTNGWDPQCATEAQTNCIDSCGCLPPPTATRTRAATATPSRTSTPAPSATPTRTPTALPPTPTPPPPTVATTRTPTIATGETPPPTATAATETPTPRPGDVDGDGTIDDADLFFVVHEVFRDPPDLRADLNLDGRVGAPDLCSLAALIAQP